LSKKFYIELIFLVLLGCFTSLSLPPYNYLIINFFTLSAFFIFLIKKTKNNKNKKLFFLYGWLFGFGYFVSNLYWISISLTFDKNFTFLIPIATVLIPGFLALFYGLISYLFSIFKFKKILSSFFLFSLIFGIVEFIRGSILTGFPWNLFAYSFSNHLEILNITAIIGTYSFNLFCISLFVSPSLFILKDNKRDFIVCVAFLITAISFFIYGYQNIQKINKAEINRYNYKIRIIGSNISINRFYNNIDPVLAIKDLIEISSPEENENIIFIWPEGILPGISQDQLIQYDWLFKNKFNENHLLIIGINSKLEQNQNTKYFNSFSIYDHNLKLIDSYNKINLVPFGEFLPFESILRKIGFKTITNNYNSFSRGKDRRAIEINKENFSLKILPLICYEIIYSGKIFTNFNFDLIINISEDGWFGQSVGPKQHFIHSIFRAIESGKYVLRSSNNGITAVINPSGVIEKQLNLNQSGYLDFNESKIIEPTLFSRFGNKIFALIILLYIFLVFSFNRIKNE
tara:strand:- start:1071 stop:2615 length:1545 start_codon:yes stop_codon:yes gene_type:complete